MATPEVILAVLGGVAIAAGLCWLAVTAALRAAHRSDRGAHRPAPRRPPRAR